MKFAVPVAHCRPVIVAAALLPILLMAGCSGQSKVSSADEVQAFKGDPKKIAEAQANSMNGRALAEQQSKAAGR